MARVRISRQGFITGKLSLEAQANTQAEVYNFGLDLCENFAIKLLGGAYKRSGTELLTILNRDIDASHSEFLKNYKFIRFFDYYYKGEKILVFLTSGNPGVPTVFGYLVDNEENTYFSRIIQVTLPEFGGMLYIEFEEYLQQVCMISSDNKLLILIPKCGLYVPNVENPPTTDYSCFLSFDFEDKFLTDIAWDSEPLYPMQNGEQLLLTCICQDKLPIWENRDSNIGPYFFNANDRPWAMNFYYPDGTKITKIADYQYGIEYPWNGNYAQLYLYAQLLDKDGNRIIGDLSKYNGLNVLFKFVKTQMYENTGDRTNAYADRMATGVYWIGGKISVVNIEDKEGNFFHLQNKHQDFLIKLKIPEQAALFPIVKGDVSKEDKSHAYYVPNWGDGFAGWPQLPQEDDNYPLPDRNKQVSAEKFFVTAFSRKDLTGYLGEWPRNLVSYKGRTYIFYKSWVWGSALGKGPMNFAMGEDSDLGFCIGWGDGKVGEVNWVFPAGKIIIGTSSGIYYSDSIIQVAGGDNISYVLPEMLTNIATNKTLPVLMGQSIIFIGSDGVTIYEIQLAGENGISVSKINSHCTGIFSQKIVRLCSTNDYLYTMGEDGECNVCCFANQIFTRRWFSYNFGGNATRLADMFSFNSGKTIGSFRRRFQSSGFDGNEVATIEHMKPLFDVYRDKASEQFFLDCAISRYSKTPIKELNNGEKLVYFFKDSDGGCSWKNFFKLISSLVTVKVIFCYCPLRQLTKIVYFGGKDVNCYILVDSKDLALDENGNPGINISPFIYENEEAKSDPSLLGQPYFNDYLKDSSIIPFFDLNILDYEFYFNEEEDVQYLTINLDRDIEIDGKYLGLIFGFDGFNNNIPFNLEFKDKDNGYFFKVTSIAPALLPQFNYKSDGVKKLYISPYTGEELDNSKTPISQNIGGEIATLEFEETPDFDPTYIRGKTKILIDDVYGAKGYNENIYTLISTSPLTPIPPDNKTHYIYWKNSTIKYEDRFEIPEEFYWRANVIAYCAANGTYSSYPSLGNCYFFVNYFTKEKIGHLIGEICQFTYDGNQGWMDFDGERVTNFVLTDEMFGPLIPPTYKPDGEIDNPGDSTPVLFLPKECVGIYIVIGLPYVSELQTVGLEGGSLFGTSEGTPGISREASLSVLFSRGGLYGNTAEEDRDKLYPLRYDAEIPEKPEKVSRDQVSATFNTALLTDKNNTVRSMYILHDIPCNFSVLNIVHDVKISDG